MIPLHLGFHWALAVINLRDKRFEYYDSLEEGRLDILRDLRKYIEDESLDKKKKKFDTSV